MLWALTKIPWRTLLVHGPTIVEAARNLYAGAKKPATETMPRIRSLDDADVLRRAVEQLEARELQQAALIADLAKQVDTLATALEVLRARLTLTLIAAAVAIALATLATTAWLAR